MELKKYKEKIFSVINILIVIYFIVFLVCEKNGIHIPIMKMVNVLWELYLIAKIFDIIREIKEKQMKDMGSDIVGLNFGRIGMAGVLANVFKGTILAGVNYMVLALLTVWTIYVARKMFLKGKFSRSLWLMFLGIGGMMVIVYGILCVLNIGYSV